MTRIWLFFAVSILILSSCVPAKKLVYLQKEDELKKRKEIPRDTILRTHKLNIQEYQIQPLDLLSISFETLGREDDAFDFLAQINPQNSRGGSNIVGALLSGILVNKEGEIEYPVLGNIKVSGLTLFEAEDAIQSVASRYVSDVVVRVRLLNFRFTVLGEVNGEQTVVSTNSRLTMMEAIGLAGGFGELADRSLIKVIRQNGGQTEIYYLNLLEEQLLESPNYYVKQNDVIIVPPLKQRTFRTYWVQNIGIITVTLSFAAIMISLFK